MGPTAPPFDVSWPLDDGSELFVGERLWEHGIRVAKDVSGPFRQHRRPLSSHFHGLQDMEFVKKVRILCMSQ